MERLISIDGKEPMPGHESLFLAILNDKMEDIDGDKNRRYIAIRYEMTEFFDTEFVLGKEAAMLRQSVSIKTDKSRYECMFVKRSTKSSKESGKFNHDMVLEIVKDKVVSKYKPEPKKDDLKKKNISFSKAIPPSSAELKPSEPIKEEAGQVMPAPAKEPEIKKETVYSRFSLEDEIE